MRLMIYIMIFAVLASCSRREESIDIEPPLTPVLTSESIWAMANKPYLRVMKEPQLNTLIVGILRRGDKVEILSKVGKDGGEVFWTEIRLPDTSATGWVKSENINAYDTKTQADTASNLLYGDRDE